MVSGRCDRPAARSYGLRRCAPVQGRYGRQARRHCAAQPGRVHAELVVFAKALGLPGAAALPDSQADVKRLAAIIEKDPHAASFAHEPAWMAHTVYQHVHENCSREPVEDYRVNFEDGYGNRPDEEEDTHTVNVGKELAAGIASGVLPPFIGIRIKPSTRRAQCTDAVERWTWCSRPGRGRRRTAQQRRDHPAQDHGDRAGGRRGRGVSDQLEAKPALGEGRYGIDVMIETPQIHHRPYRAELTAYGYWCDRTDALAGCPLTGPTTTRPWSTSPPIPVPRPPGLRLSPSTSCRWPSPARASTSPTAPTTVMPVRCRAPRPRAPTDARAGGGERWPSVHAGVEAPLRRRPAFAAPRLTTRAGTSPRRSCR